MHYQQKSQSLTHYSYAVQDTAKLLQLNRGQVVTAYSAFQRLAQKAGAPGQPVEDPPSQLPPIPADAQKALDTEGLKEGVPSLADIGYHDQPTSPFKVLPTITAHAILGAFLQGDH